MSAAGMVTLLGVALLALALVIYLGLVAYHLTKVNFTLGTVLIGVRAIANQTEPLGAVLASIARDLTGMDEAVDGLVQTASLARIPATRRTRARAAR